METKEIRIGERDVEIEAFSSRRTSHTFKAAAALFKRYGELQTDMAEFRKKYAVENPRTLTREMCDDAAIAFRERAAQAAELGNEKAQKALEDTAEKWERRLDVTFKDRPSIELPGEPSLDELIVHVLPKAIENAEEEVARLLGLIILSNERFAEIRKQARSDGTPLLDAMLEQGDQVLDESDPDQLLDLLLAGAELFLGDMNARRERVGKLKAAFEEAFPTRAPEENETEDETEPSSASPSTPSPETSSGSSTGSDEPTGGTKDESSTASPSAEPSSLPT